MKVIAVIVNNGREWLYFVDTLQFKLSKENKPYNTVSKALVDISEQMKYVYVDNHVSSIESIRGYLWDDYITTSNHIDEELENWIKLHIRGE